MTEQEMCKIFSDNLNRIMSYNGIRQTDIVNALNVAKGTVSGWCSGQNIPRTDTMSALINYLNVELSDLLCKHTEQKEKPAGQTTDEPNEKILKFVEILRELPEDKLDLVIEMSKALRGEK